MKKYRQIMLVATMLTQFATVSYAAPLSDDLVPVGSHAIPAQFMSHPPAHPKSQISPHAHVAAENVPGSPPAAPPGGDDNFRPAPPDTNTSGSAGNPQGPSGPVGKLNLGGDNPSIDDSDTGANGGDQQEGGLVALPDRSKENEGAELNEALRNLMPPTSFIHEARKRRAAIEREDASPVDATQKPLTRTLNVTLRPGEMPPVIHLAYGAVTTLTFSDVTGAPWYVSNIVTDTNSYATTRGAGSDDVKSNIVTIVPKTRYSAGRNASIMLEHAAVPVIIQLDTGMDSSTVDYRVDLSVMQRGPNAKEDFVETGMAPAQDADLQSFVDGIPPKGAKAMKVSNPSVEAWQFKGMLYVRTSDRLLSPIWMRRSNSNISGDSVYVLRMTPDIMISSDGEPSSVMIESRK